MLESSPERFYVQTFTINIYMTIYDDVDCTFLILLLLSARFLFIILHLVVTVSQLRCPDLSFFSMYAIAYY